MYLDEDAHHRAVSAPSSCASVWFVVVRLKGCRGSGGALGSEPYIPGMLRGEHGVYDGVAPADELDCLL
jgi:hypothetical protein